MQDSGHSSRFPAAHRHRILNRGLQDALVCRQVWQEPEHCGRLRELAESGGDMDVTTLIERCQAIQTRLIRFLYCDNGGIIRGKTTALPGLADRLRNGIGLTVAMMAMNSLDQLQAVEGMGPVGEIRLVPDLDSFTTLPYADGQA